MLVHMFYSTSSTLKWVILSDIWYVYLYFAPSGTLKKVPDKEVSRNVKIMGLHACPPASTNSSTLC